MSLRNIVYLAMFVASLAGLVLQFTGADQDGYWRGSSFIVLLVGVALLIALDFKDGRQE